MRPRVEKTPAGPDWAGAQLRSTIRVLMLPALFAVAIYGLHLRLGSIGLYGFVVVLGLVVLGTLRRGPDALLALAIMYLPLSRLYAARLAPGLNGTNLLEVGMAAVWIGQAVRMRQPLFRAYPFTRIVGVWLALSAASVLPAIAAIGLQPFIWNYMEPFRGFLDQFLIFYLFVNMIRDRDMARRVIVYIMFSAGIVFLYGIQEWWGTRGYASIEKSRLLGPLGQPNDFAALMVYSLAPFLAWGAYYFPRWKSLRIAPVVLVGLKVLLAAFSRGAYLAFALEGLAVAFVKSRRFFLLVLAVVAGVYLFVPSLVPNSMKDRVEQTYQDRVPGAQIDKSADSRLILWQAAIDMSLDHPLLGEGFDQFSRLVPSHVSGYDDGVTGGATDNQNMFLYAASNMGLPNLAAFLLLLVLALARGWRLYARRDACDVDRIIGLGIVTMVAGLVGVNMFGTHVIDTAVDGFFWVLLAALARLQPADARIGTTGA
ncbi:O-antigen ligase [Thiomonas sp. FB-6]|uniref:O-antigen ligase family protein n=1 Tax=Thiomonas sp. FB-6 TaxID=1158291 RepID=UPI000374638D|nr:O-antigen ligase family protein [Thiomonas sp. FB-6]